MMNKIFGYLSLVFAAQELVRELVKLATRMRRREVNRRAILEGGKSSG